VKEWFRTIKAEGPPPGSNFDYASRLTEVNLLGVMAARFGGRIDWDPVLGEVTNRPGLNAFVKEPVRPRWKYGYDIWC
jgi:hypothetical protein